MRTDEAKLRIVMRELNAMKAYVESARRSMSVSGTVRLSAKSVRYSWRQSGDEETWTDAPPAGRRLTSETPHTTLERHAPAIPADPEE